MTVDQAALTYAVMNALDKGAKDALKDKLIDSTIDKIRITLPNGVVQEMSISHPGKVTGIKREKHIDYKKAIDYALDNGLPLPMVPQQIIPEHVDEAAIENQPWFQEHADMFIEVKKEPKKSVGRVTIKDVK